MGWTPVNTISVKREFNGRTIVVNWTDSVLGEQQKTFPFEDEDKALQFVMETFTQRAM